MSNPRAGWPQLAHPGHDEDARRAQDRDFLSRLHLVHFGKPPPEPPKIPPAAAKPPIPATITEAIAQVADEHGLPVEALSGPDKHKRVMLARQEAYARCYKLPGATFVKIGKALGGRDHTTVINGIRRHLARTKGEAA